MVLRFVGLLMAAALLCVSDEDLLVAAPRGEWMEDGAIVGPSRLPMRRWRFAIASLVVLATVASFALCMAAQQPEQVQPQGQLEKQVQEKVNANLGCYAEFYSDLRNEYTKDECRIIGSERWPSCGSAYHLHNHKGVYPSILGAAGSLFFDQGTSVALELLPGCACDKGYVWKIRSAAGATAIGAASGAVGGVPGGPAGVGMGTILGGAGGQVESLFEGGQCVSLAELKKDDPDAFGAYNGCLATWKGHG